MEELLLHVSTGGLTEGCFIVKLGFEATGIQECIRYSSSQSSRSANQDENQSSENTQAHRGAG